MADLASNMLAFCSLLRTQYRIDVGHGHAREALRAIETIGVENPLRVRYAMRAVCCSRAGELERFDAAFDAFFRGDQPLTRRPLSAIMQAGKESAAPVTPSRREPQAEKTSAHPWQVLHARYSPQRTHEQTAPVVPDTDLAETLAVAGKLIAGLRLGRSRRWKPHLRGRRFDLRGTLRASLQTGGDPARIRTLGHPLRNPRIVLLLDASRSMSGHAERLLQFAYALCQRSRRTNVFVFSTALRDITRELRKMTRRGERRLEALGEAWGGGTRIGAALLEIVRKHSARLDADTLVIIASDGLDVGETELLQRAMRQIYQQCAGVIWLNPHAGAPGFEPSARGIHAALPYISVLLDANDLQAIGGAARYVRR